MGSEQGRGGQEEGPPRQAQNLGELSSKTGRPARGGHHVPSTAACPSEGRRGSHLGKPPTCTHIHPDSILVPQPQMQHNAGTPHSGVCLPHNRRKTKQTKRNSKNQLSAGEGNSQGLTQSSESRDAAPRDSLEGEGLGSRG